MVRGHHLRPGYAPPNTFSPSPQGSPVQTVLPGKGMQMHRQILQGAPLRGGQTQGGQHSPGTELLLPGQREGFQQSDVGYPNLMMPAPVARRVQIVGEEGEAQGAFHSLGKQTQNETPFTLANIPTDGRGCSPSQNGDELDFLWEGLSLWNPGTPCPPRETTSAASNHSYTHDPYSSTYSMRTTSPTLPNATGSPAGNFVVPVKTVPGGGGGGGVASPQQVLYASRMAQPMREIPFGSMLPPELKAKLAGGRGRSASDTVSASSGESGVSDASPKQRSGHRGTPTSTASSSEDVSVNSQAAARMVVKEMKMSRERKDVRIGYNELRAIAELNMSAGKLPVSSWWRVCMELADVCKKEHPPHAIYWLCVVVALAPAQATGWAELAKICDDHNLHSTARFFLREGLARCDGVERSGLTIKALRHFELDHLIRHRAHLARHVLYHSVVDTTIERSWRVILEGSVFESRQRHDAAAERISGYLVHEFPRQGSVHLEAAKQLERRQQYGKAIDVVENGLKKNPKFGPLVFTGIRLHEKHAWATATPIEEEEESIAGGASTLTGQLFDLVRTDEGAGKKIDLAPLIAFVEKSRRFLSPELLWKLYFEVAQVAERACQFDISRMQYSHAYTAMAAQPTSRNLVWRILLGGARMELARGDSRTAFRSMQAAYQSVKETQAKSGNEGLQNHLRTMAVIKLDLARYYEFDRKIDYARTTLEGIKTTSWRACLELISLELRSGTGAEAAFAVVQEMLLHRQAPHKSVGRLWASAIQLCNELGKRQGRNFKAIEMFDLAREQVGKAGEVWCEGARMHMDPLQEELFNLDKAEGYLQLAMKYTPQFGDPFVEYVKLGLLKYGRGGTWFADLSRTVAIAEPNYGQMWQFCKRSSIQTFREILAHAVDLVALELHIYSSLYQPLLMGASDSESTAATRTSFRLQLPWFFVTALPTLNYQTRSIAALPDNARRQIIFGSETLSP